MLVTEVLGAHMINGLSGDFSLQAENAFMINRGKLTPIKHAMIAGNAFEILKKVDAVCKETRQEGSVIAPLIRFNEVQLIG